MVRAFQLNLITVGWACLAFPILLEASTFETIPQAKVEAGCVDNLRVSTADPDEACFVAAELAGTISRTTRSQNFELRGGVRRTEYISSSEDNDNSSFLKVAWEDRPNRRISWGAIARAARDTLLRTGQLDDQRTESTGIGDVEIGVQEADSTRTQLELSPRIRFELGKSTEVELGVSASRLGYDSAGEALGRVDSSFSTGSASLIRTLGVRDELSVTMFKNRFDPEVGADTNVDGGILAWDKRLSSSSSWRIEAGVAKVETGGNSESFLLGRIQYRKDIPKGYVTAEFQRSKAPSGFGELVSANRADIRLRRMISRRYTWISSLHGTTVSDSVREGANRDYFETHHGIEIILARHLHLSVLYRYRWVEGSSRNADSNGVLAQLIFQPRTGKD